MKSAPLSKRAASRKAPSTLMRTACGNGHAVISVAPPFGAGRRATAILESFDPIKSVVSEPAREIADVAEAVRPANDPPVTSDEAMTNFSGDEGPVIEDVAAPIFRLAEASASHRLGDPLL